MRTSESVYQRMNESGESVSIPAAQEKHDIAAGDRVRRLMPLECFRLQGFTDEQFFKLVEAGIPESQLYKLAGNSVTTNVVTAVGRKLLEEIQKLEDTDAESHSK